MKQQGISTGWSMSVVGENGWLPAIVPGSVYNDLLNNCKMENPYWRDNELQALAIMENDFTYETVFVPAEEIMSYRTVIMRFEGIDTLGDIYLNGMQLGTVNNMHRTWEYDVKDRLKVGENLLQVILHSPTRFIAKAYGEKPIDGATQAMRGFPHLRKAHCMFGWDWGPRLPDAGIWRPVSLIGYNTARLNSIYVSQKHQVNSVMLNLQIDVQEGFCIHTKRFGMDDLRGYEFSVAIKSPSGEWIAEEKNTLDITLVDPQLWWPNGYGEQPLYTIRVTLQQSDGVLDIWEKKIGLRTVTMHIEKDDHGESFAHRVNGIDIFAMGADYIPEDNILSCVTPKHTRDLLLQAKLANHNCIRVWGGGYYPNDWFYDACDELGLLVWQDFMFACAAYDLTEEFEENICAEFVDNIKRIRHHACLGLWCGNNEMEGFAFYDNMIHTHKERADYIKMYEYILPKVLKSHDPNTFYWPSSSSSGGGFDDPNDEHRGDVHDWSVWHGNEPFTAYRKHKYRYLSEFGFQSFPSLKSCEQFTMPEDRNIFSYVMEKHQRSDTGNGKIMEYLEQTFLYPTDFDTLLYASQLLQAEGVRYGVEHFRRIRGICMGTVIWQLNDCWPVASWSSIDYYGRWKALHYYEKRFFAPLAISCEEEGLLSQNPVPNAQPYHVKKSIRLCVVNETMTEQQTTVVWSLCNAESQVKRSGRQEIKAPRLSSVWLERENMEEADLYGDYVSFALEQGDKVISQGTVMFCMPKYFRFNNPRLSAQVEGDEIVITSGAYAKSVEIKNAEDTLFLEDNYFDMDAGQRRVKILRGCPENLRLRSVYDIR